MRAKRIGAVKVTISLDETVLISGKHKALDERLTLSDYIQGLIKRDLDLTNNNSETLERVIGSSTAENPPDDIEEVDLFIDGVEADEVLALQGENSNTESNTTDIKDIIQSMKSEGMSFKQIADKLNEQGIQTPKGRAWSRQNVENHCRQIK